jgi:hypothetical protein
MVASETPLSRPNAFTARGDQNYDHIGQTSAKQKEQRKNTKRKKEIINVATAAHHKPRREEGNFPLFRRRAARANSPNYECCCKL